MKIRTATVITIFLMTLLTQAYADTFSALEAKTGVKLGLSALNTANGEQINHRAHERFATASTYKLLVAAAILEKSVAEPQIMNEKILIEQKDLVDWAPVAQAHVNQSMTVAELTEAAARYSDGTAADLLTRRLGGPKALTEYARSLGDQDFVNTHYEPVDTSPGNPYDSTMPDAMRRTLEKLLLGNRLQKAKADQLRDWMIANTTGDTRIRAGVPQGWIVADKTGAGYYGVRNDIAVIWPTGCQPIILSLYTTQDKKEAVFNDDVLVQSTRMVIEDFAKQDPCIRKALNN